MIRIKDTRLQSTASVLERALDTAAFYGFVPLEEALRSGKTSLPPQKNGIPLFARRDERALNTSARMCLTAKRNPGDILLLSRLVKNAPGTRTPTASYTLELHVLGASAAIAEALLIIVVSGIAEDIGVQDRVLTINSIGSLDSSNRFVRDVGSFLRKHLDSIAPALRARAAEDPLSTLIQLFEKGHPAMHRAPQSVEYLTEEERRRFWDLLEHLEISDIPYELSPMVLGSRDVWAHTLFELSRKDEETGMRVPFALGGRYDPLATRLLGHPSVAAVAALTCEIRGKSKAPASRTPSTPLYFAHLGAEARRKALPMLEGLRREGILVEQSLLHERLQEQMERAKRKKISHMLIMGHKEALEGTILVREMATNAQEAIPLRELTGYLRRQKVRT